MKKSSFNKMLFGFQIALLALFTSILILKAYSSLKWRMEHDTPLLHYAAFLMDKYDLVPYRDIFETSMPGTFAFHYFIGKTFGYGDVAFRFVDLALLCVLFIAIYGFMRRFGRLVGIWAFILFGLLYLSMGQTMSLQRDYIGVIPISFALLCIPAKTGKPVRLLRFSLIGILFGISILIKPHLAIALPVIFGTLLVFRWHSQRRSMLDFFKCAAVSGISLLIPISIALLWLASNSALESFKDILFNYIPLHNSLTGSHKSISGLPRILYLIKNTSMFGGFGALFLCSLFAYYHVSMDSDANKETIFSLTCLFFCTLAYTVYPSIAGMFWTYHYMPFVYFCALSAGLCFFKYPQYHKLYIVCKIYETLPMLILVIALTVQLPLSKYIFVLASDLRSKSDIHAPKSGRVDEIAGWLKSHMHPGDSVQPLDWTGGSVHAMLLAKVKLSTRFLYTYHFYHNINHPYIAKLRLEFINELVLTKPKFFIEILEDMEWPTGENTTLEFPELHNFMDTHYKVAYEGHGYLIYERMDNNNRF